jgi:hypothetical protein
MREALEQLAELREFVAMSVAMALRQAVFQILQTFEAIENAIKSVKTIDFRFAIFAVENVAENILFLFDNVFDDRTLRNAVEAGKLELRFVAMIGAEFENDVANISLELAEDFVIAVIVAPRKREVASWFRIAMANDNRRVCRLGNEREGHENGTDEERSLQMAHFENSVKSKVKAIYPLTITTRQASRFKRFSVTSDKFSTFRMHPQSFP